MVDDEKEEDDIDDGVVDDDEEDDGVINGDEEDDGVVDDDEEDDGVVDGRNACIIADSGDISLKVEIKHSFSSVVGMSTFLRFTGRILC